MFVPVLLFTGCFEETASNLGTIDSSSSALIKSKARLEFVNQPGGGTSGAAWSQQPQVVIKDDTTGETIREGVDAFATITLTIAEGSGTLTGTVAATANDGVATFTNLKIDALGNKKLLATKGDLAMVGGYPSASATSNVFTVTAAGASQFAMSVASSSITTSVCTPVTLSIKDAAGNSTVASSSISYELFGASNGTFYSDSGCTSSMTTAVFSSGASSATIYYLNEYQEGVNIGIYDTNAAIGSTSSSLTIVLPQVSKISVGSTTGVGCFLFSNGKVNCNGTTVNIPDTVAEIKSYYVGSNSWSHCARTTTGNVYCWGLNAYGQLGQGNTTTYNTPQLVNLGGTATAIEFGYQSACAIITISSVPTLKCWGTNTNRNIGDGTTTTRLSPTVASALPLAAGVYPAKLFKGASGIWLYVVLTDGTVTVLGNSANPALISGVSSVLQITSTTNYTSTSPSESILSTTCFIKTDNSVSCFGANQLGQFGNGTTTSSATPVAISGLSNIQDIAVTVGNVCVRKSDNTIWCAGDFHSDFMNSQNVWYPRIEFTRRSFTQIPGLRLTSMVSSHFHICGVTADTIPEVLCFSQRATTASPTVTPTIQANPLKKTKITISAPKTYVIANTCTALTISFYKNGTLATPEAGFTVSLAETAGTGVFYSSSSCGAASQITSVYFPTGTNTRTVYLKSSYSSSTGTNSFISGTPSNTGVGSAVISVAYPGAPTVLAIKDTITISGTDSYLSLHLIDNFGIPATKTSTQSISINSSDNGATGLVLYSGAGGSVMSNPATYSWPSGTETLTVYSAGPYCNFSTISASISALGLSATKLFNDSNACDAN